jgi:hypothetical protein
MLYGLELIGICLWLLDFKVVGIHTVHSLNHFVIPSDDPSSLNQVLLLFGSVSVNFGGLREAPIRDDQEQFPHH